jgi:glycine/D-amino acid oxidase-like deaminating enzyme
MKVCVVGGGLAGLGVTWHLLNLGAEVTLYSVGEGASSISTGLLYPFPGRTAGRTHMAKEGMAASLKLLDAAEEALGRPVASRSGILRLPWASWQKKRFLKCIEKDSDAVWKYDGMWVEGGVTVFAKPYLEGLKKACGKAKFIEQRVENYSELDADAIVLATGRELVIGDLPLRPVKGQALLCRCKEPLPYSLVGNGHITLTEDPSFCLVGSTYENEFTSNDPDPAVAGELIARAALFYPAAKNFEVVDIMAGVRMMPVDDTKPLIKKIDEKVWVFSGLGSRGLLYHALFGEKLSSEIMGIVQ